MQNKHSIMKKTSILLIALFAFGLYTATAQVTDAEKQLRTKSADTLDGWKTAGIFGANFSQTSLTNWAAGGQNSLAINGLFRVSANYKKNKNVWDNSLDMGYGIMRQGKEKKFMKTDDKIDLLSKYGREAFKNFYYAAMLNFRTQMAAGYNYPNDSVKISDWLAPAYTVAAIGMDYKPNDYFSAFIAPFTGKLTYVNNQALADAGAFGVEKAKFDDNGVMISKGELTKKEFGGYIRIIYSRSKFEKEYLKNVALTTKIDLFSNYLSNPQNIDINWETLISLKVNKYITVSINNNMIYDDDVIISVDKNDDGIIDEEGPRLQVKNILGVGFAYKF